MPVLGENYSATGGVQMPLTGRYIGQTWTQDGDKNLTEVILKLAYDDDFIHLDSSVNEIFFEFQDFDYVPEVGKTLGSPTFVILGTPSFEIPIGTRFRFEIDYIGDPLGGTINLQATDGTEVINEDPLLPTVAAYSTFIHTLAATTTLWSSIDHIAVGPLSAGSVTLRTVRVYLIFPLTANLKVSIHEFDSDDNIVPEPITNGVNTNAVSTTALTTTPTNTSFLYATPPFLADGVKYALVIYYEEFFYETTIQNNSSATVLIDNTSPSYANGEGISKHHKNDWSDEDDEYGTFDLDFEIYYDDITTYPEVINIDWSADCIEQISKMNSLLSDFQDGIDLMFATLPSVFQADYSKEPTNTGWQSAYVEQGLELPIDEDFNLLWFKTDDNEYGGNYQQVNDVVIRKDNYLPRGNNHLYPLLETSVGNNIGLFMTGPNNITAVANWSPFGLTISEPHIIFNVREPSRLLIELIWHLEEQNGAAVDVGFNYALAKQQPNSNFPNGPKESLRYNGGADAAVIWHTIPQRVLTTGIRNIGISYLHPDILPAGTYQLFPNFICGTAVVVRRGGSQIPTIDTLATGNLDTRKVTINCEVIAQWQYQS